LGTIELDQRVKSKYVAALACRNEEELIRGALENVLSQTLPASAFVVADDGSTDRTASIVEEYLPKVTLLKLNNPRFTTRGINQSLALIRGVGSATNRVPHWDYLLKIDADSFLPCGYVESLLRYFNKDSRLGVASGVPRGERMWKNNASDGAKIFRRKCWDEIGGLDPVSGFDMYALLKARKEGWRVSSFPDIRYEQKRSWEKRRLSRWILSGQVRHRFGFSPFHTTLVASINLRKRPRILGGLVFLLTFFAHRLSGSEKPFDEDFYRFMDEFCKVDAMERLYYVLDKLKF
jgi:glycosyltransferase involved in cell wall biosynthesis